MPCLVFGDKPLFEVNTELASIGIFETMFSDISIDFMKMYFQISTKWYPFLFGVSVFCMLFIIAMGHYVWLNYMWKHMYYNMRYTDVWCVMKLYQSVIQHTFLVTIQFFMWRIEWHLNTTFRNNTCLYYKLYHRSLYIFCGQSCCEIIWYFSFNGWVAMKLTNTPLNSATPLHPIAVREFPLRILRQFYFHNMVCYAV